MLFRINNALIGKIYQSLIVTSIYSCCFSFVVIEIRTQEPVARYSVTNKYFGALPSTMLMWCAMWQRRASVV